MEATEPHIQRYLKWLCISNKYENSIIYQTTEFLNSYNEFRRDICQLQPANSHKMGADIRFCKLAGVIKGHKDNKRIWTINFSKLREELKINENTIIDV